MPTFEEMLHIRLGKLEEATTNWTATVKRLTDLAKDADDLLMAKSEKADWTGENATVTKPFVRKTAKEFQDALAQATSTRNILRDAHTAFTKHKTDLKTLVSEAPAQGLSIGANGTVRSAQVPVPYAPGPPAIETPLLAPDTSAKEQKKIDAMVKRIETILYNAAEDDQTIARALCTIAGKDRHNFTGKSFENLNAADKAQARADAKDAARYAKHLSKDGTARNLDELKKFQRLLHSNMKDSDTSAVFAAAFYKTMGAEEALEFYANVSLDSTSLNDKTRVGLVHGIQNDMGTMLGQATDKGNPNYLGKDWTTQLIRAGHAELDVTRNAGTGTKVYGHQVLGSLLRDGKYETTFLTDVGRDMVAMERKDPQIWDRNASLNMDMTLNHDKTGGKGFHPLTGLMEAMTHNPEASTAFFNEPVREDSNHDGIVTAEDKTVKDYDSNYDGEVNEADKPMSMVDYMLDRSPDADADEYVKNGESRTGQAALGNALEAAVTHRTPGDDDAQLVKHSEAMGNVMEKVVAKIGANPELVAAKPGDPPGPLSGLSQHFGNMAAEYMPDLQAAAENGANQAQPFGHMADFKKDQMAGFLGATAQDPKAYGAITNAQQAYTTALVHDVFANPSKHGDVDAAVRNAVHPGGEISGMMTEARAYAIHDTQSHGDQEFNDGVAEQSKWANRIVSAFGAKYVEMIPVGGDAVTWLQEDISASAVKHAEQDTSGESRRESAAEYTNAEKAAKDSAEAAVASAAKGTGTSREDVKEFQGSASTQTASAHSIGRDLVASSEPKSK